jgi:5-methylcytosine-specific restriction protein A
MEYDEANIMEDKPSIDQDFENKVNELRKQRQSIRRDYMMENEEQAEQPFEVGRKYRREEIAGAIGSDQTVVGIFWGSRYPDKVVCTAGGEKAEKFGFQDKELDDGSWYYYGQGTKGNQSWNTANQMVRDRKVWFFKTHRASMEERARGNNKNWYEFKGNFYCDNWENETPTSGPREGDQMIRFHLARE